MNVQTLGPHSHQLKLCPENQGAFRASTVPALKRAVPVHRWRYQYRDVNKLDSAGADLELCLLINFDGH
jgi:hypothetical protein